MFLIEEAISKGKPWAIEYVYMIDLKKEGSLNPLNVPKLIFTRNGAMYLSQHDVLVSFGPLAVFLPLVLMDFNILW